MHITIERADNGWIINQYNKELDLERRCIASTAEQLASLMLDIAASVDDPDRRPVLTGDV